MLDRPYQLAAVETVRALWGQGKRRVVLCMPVGAGKSRTSEILIQRVRAADFAACYFVAHTTELVSSPAHRMEQIGVEAGVVKAGWTPSPEAGVQVCSVHSLVNRPIATLQRRDGRLHTRCVLIVDEGHRVRARTYQAIYDRIGAAYDTVYVLILTATPYRGDGRGMRLAADALVEAETPSWLVAAGILHELEYYSWEPPTDGDDPTAVRAALSPKLAGDVVRTWLEKARGLPTIARCCNRAHARDLARRFREADVRSESIDGTMPDELRERLLARLAVERAHPLAVEVLCSGGTILEEGYDSASTYRHIASRPWLWLGGVETEPSNRVWSWEPPAPWASLPAYEPLACLIDAAPTASRGAWIQRLGRVSRAFTEADAAAWAERGLRAAPKLRAVVLCHSGNLQRHGFLAQHEGFQLTDDRPGSTSPAASAYPGFRPPQTATCPACFASFSRPATDCPVCHSPCDAPSIPDEDASRPLQRRVWDPSSAPPTDDEKVRFLRSQWAGWTRKRDSRAAQGLPPYSTGWVSQRYRAKFAQWPDWSTNRAVAREFGAKV